MARFRDEIILSTIMKLLLALLALLNLLAPQVSSLTGVQNNPNIFGNELNFWSKLETGGWDVSIFIVVVVHSFYYLSMQLTRGATSGSISIPVPQNGPILIQPNATALVIIDMQNFFLHESLGGDPLGRAIVRTFTSKLIMNECIDEQKT